MRGLLFAVLAMAGGCVTGANQPLMDEPATRSAQLRQAAAAREADFTSWLYPNNLTGTSRFNGDAEGTIIWLGGTRDSIEDVLRFYEERSGSTNLVDLSSGGNWSEDSTVVGRSTIRFDYSAINFSRRPEDPLPREKLIGIRTSEAFYTIFVSQEPVQSKATNTRIYLIRDLPTLPQGSLPPHRLKSRTKIHQ